jgi:ubiquinone/menaquinone biosynthesis C-methylase UbiE
MGAGLENVGTRIDHMDKEPTLNSAPDHYASIRSFFDNELDWWQDVYGEGLPRGFFSFEMRRRLALVADLLTAEIQKKDNPAVLECGCGPGDILERLTPLRCRLTGVDLIPRYLDIASKRIPGATLLEGNVERLPFPDASFDVVYAVGLFQYVDDDRKSASEIARVTKEGGMVLISVANYRMLHLLTDPYYYFRSLKRLVGKGDQASEARFAESKMHRYSLVQLRELFRRYNLHEIRSLTTSYGPPKFWRKEILPLSASTRISETMRGWSDRRWGSPLKRVGNHFVITLRKGPNTNVDVNT